jgi:hypothetical protein
MSNTAEKLLTLAANFEKLASESLIKEAKKKEDKKKKKAKPPFWMKNKDLEDSNSAKDSKDSKKSDKKSSK